MSRTEIVAKRVERLKGLRNILLTKGGQLNEGEIKWIAHLEEQLEECGIFYIDNQEIAA